ncbi:MAG: hypothetical protein QJR12_00450 [Mycobacterium sp.]|uniref:hypothetical protein n=1 Tax=Mycobacterium sp. TaxID=1785 RepID=UPI0026362740|nr:hypothetical protein [Mycobacterium sp.]MDI3312793.1 hypothetical protein [Mycobacterium sp.]
MSGVEPARYERGITPDLITATSVGARRAAFIAPVRPPRRRCRNWPGCRSGYDDATSTGYACARRPPRTPLDIATRALSMLIRHRVAADIVRVPKRARLIVLPLPFPVEDPRPPISGTLRS